MRASAEDGTTLREWAERSSPHYRDIRVPVFIIAGDGDKAVDYRGHAMRLHYDVPGSQLRILPHTGHMVHHVHPDAVIEAIETVFEMADNRSSPRRSGDESRSERALAREAEAARSTGA
jgi:pimeloyl-ACP methyl ester carboxylesterase